jgi:hypothetical protein
VKNTIFSNAVTGQVGIIGQTQQLRQQKAERGSSGKEGKFINSPWPAEPFAGKPKADCREQGD